MSTTSDDLDAVRTVVTALQGFDPKDQERIIRWAREKLGLPSNIETPLPPEQKAPIQESTPPKDTSPQGLVPSIKAFFNAKNPESDTHFAAAVAYYYRFEAPENERKEIITAKDLQEACRQIDRERLKKPGQTLINAHHDGWLDKGSARGAYSINAVGENLVAMALPAGTSSPKPTRRRAAKTKTTLQKAKPRKAK